LLLINIFPNTPSSDCINLINNKLIDLNVTENVEIIKLFNVSVNKNYVQYNNIFLSDKMA